MATDPRETFAAGRLLARTRAPYMRSMLVGLVPIDAPQISTIGVTKNGVLMVNWEFIAKVNAEEMCGLFIHECLHLCLKHHDRGTGKDPHRANVAGDLAINPAIVEMGCRLPGGDLSGCFPETKEFPLSEGFKKGLTQDEYYYLLEKNGKGGGGNDPSGGRIGHGQCGGCAGNPNPGEPDATNPASRPDAELDRMVRQVAEEVRNAKANGGMGTIPGFFQKWADDMLRPAEIPWPVKLGRSLRGGLACAAGQVDHRYNGPSRRQAGLGYGVGRAVLPRLQAPRPEVGVIIDTSGSMGQDETTTAAVETNGIIRAVGGNVTVCTCDASVAGIKKVESVKEAVKLLRGGGGTDMRPAFAAMAKLKPRLQVIVCITDGVIPDPGPAPRGTKVIWVVVGPYASTAALKWGDVIVIPPKAKAA